MNTIRNERLTLTTCYSTKSLYCDVQGLQISWNYLKLLSSQ